MRAGKLGRWDERCAMSRMQAKEVEKETVRDGNWLANSWIHDENLRSGESSSRVPNETIRSASDTDSVVFAMRSKNVWSNG
eukprot:1665155-Pleurochrysis_carterae.AAC.1